VPTALLDNGLSYLQGIKDAQAREAAARQQLARQSLQQSVELCRKIEAGPEDPLLQAALLALARLADG